MILTSPPKNQNFVFFDFDGTLTHHDTLMPFLRFCVGNSVYYAKLLLLSPTLIGYLLGKIPNNKTKEKVLISYLKGMDVLQAETYAENFAREIIPTLLRPCGIERLLYHQNNGDYCVLVSASPELYLLPWAKKMGFDALLGTKLAVERNKITGKIDGNNCYGEEKVVRIESEFTQFCWQDSSAYSDSRADLPMLSHVMHAFLLSYNDFKRLRKD